MLILLAVAVIVVIWLIIARPGSSSGGEAEPEIPALPTDLNATATPPATAGASPGGTPSPAATPECDSSDVVVIPVTDAQDYAAGVQPQLSLSISNTSKEACTINAGTSQMVFEVTSGPERYWISTDCQTDPADNVILLEPAKPVTTTPIVWDRTRSSPDTCDTAREPVPGGGASYHLSASVGGIESDDTRQFLLY